MTNELLDAAKLVVWFDWSGNDEDAIAAIERLRKAVYAIQPATREWIPEPEIAGLLSVLRNPYGRYEDLRDARLKAADMIQWLHADAARYRWLRLHSTGPMEPWSSHDNPESLDAVVDASIAADEAAP